jgi:uncharacterized membrane protein
MINQRKMIFILGLVGFLISSYLFFIGTRNNSPVCLSNSGCDFVLKSNYSKFLGLSVALWGVLYFSSILILNYFEKYKNLLKIIASLGFLFALYLIYIQSFVLKSFCFYCLIADISTILIFVLIFK